MGYSEGAERSIDCGGIWRKRIRATAIPVASEFGGGGGEGFRVTAIGGAESISTGGSRKEV